MVDVCHPSLVHAGHKHTHGQHHFCAVILAKILSGGGSFRSSRASYALNRFPLALPMLTQWTSVRNFTTSTTPHYKCLIYYCVPCWEVFDGIVSHVHRNRVLVV